MKKHRTIGVIKEDLIYAHLPEKTQKEIKDMAVKALKVENPQSDNPRLNYMKDFLLIQKIRQIVMEKAMKGEFLNEKAKEHS